MAHCLATCVAFEPSIGPSLKIRQTLLLPLIFQDLTATVVVDLFTISPL